jgi:hypothetical protein
MSNPLLVKNKVAEAAITANSIVKFGSTDDFVVLGAAAGDAVIGVVEGIAPAAGERVDVVLGGIAEVKLAGAVTRGGGVVANASGLAVAAAAGNRAIGYVLQSGVAGDIVEVLIAPHTV